MAYIDYVSELIGTIPKLPPPLAEKLINRAFSNIRDVRQWSWLIGQADITTPAEINSGLCSVVTGSASVTCDAIASAALSPAITANPPLASATLGAGRQIRFGINNPIYSILAVDASNPAALVLTLDRVYAGTTAASSVYRVYRCYHLPPDTDFLRYLCITNVTNGYSIYGKRLYHSQEKLNAIDPQRGGSGGNAYILASYRNTPTGRPIHEWYPHPINLAVYSCLYRKRGTALSSTVDLPTTLPESLLMARAKVLAGEWALANVTTIPELAQTNWVMYLQFAMKEYRDEMIQAIKQDDEISPLKAFLQGGQADFPLGGEFMQSHDVSGLIGGI